jgi:hypothetical protein
LRITAGETFDPLGLLSHQDLRLRAGALHVDSLKGGGSAELA